MSLPANDASSYGLTHDSPSNPRVNSFMPHSRARRSSLSTMSSTSSISSYTSSGSSPKTKPSGGTTRHARKASKEKRAVADASSSSNGSANGSASASPKGTFWATFIDRWEVPRKALHSSIGFVTLSLYSAAQGADGAEKPIVKALLTAFTAIAPLDIIRLRYPTFERAYEYAVGFLMRESEKSASNGVIWYLIGCSFVLYAYPLDIAVVAILILSWADTSASTFGRLFGRYTPKLPARLLGLPLAPRKSLAGFIAGSLTGALVAASFWGHFAPRMAGPGAQLSWTWEHGVSGVAGTGGWLGLSVLAVVTGLISGVAEALDVGKLDDNLTLPVIAGGCILGVLRFVGLFA